MYYDKDADLGLLKGKTIGVVGVGSQRLAHECGPESCRLVLLTLRRPPAA